MMRATSRSRSPRTLALAGTLAALLVLAPTTALADDHDDLVELPGPTVDDENVEDAPAAPVAAQAAACDDLLVTHSPTSSEGNELAVAITAQAVEAGLDGWTNVAWEAAEGTALRAVFATELDGSVTELPAETTGSAFDVLSLTFCGTTGMPAEEPVEDAPEEAEPEQEPEQEPEPAAPAPAPTPAPSTPAPSTQAPEPSEPSSTTEADDTDDAPEADDSADAEETEEPSADAEDAVEPAEADEEAEEDGGEESGEIEPAEEEPEAEVLGVQLTREDEADGGLGAWVVALAVVALLGAGAGVVIWSRRS